MKPREVRQAEALERQEEARRRKPSEQLALLDQRPGNAIKERSRLEGLPTDNSREMVMMRRRGRKAGLSKEDIKHMTGDQLVAAVVSAERANNAS